MKLLFDENLSRKLMPSVEDLFPGSAHAHVGMGSGASDRQVWDYAGQNGFVIITADNDFLSLAETLGHPPKVILLENCDYPTNVAVRIIQAEASRILQFAGGGVYPSLDFPPRATALAARHFAMKGASVTMQREVLMAIDIRGMAPLLQVFDMPTSIKFYRDVLGFEVTTTSNPRGEHFDWALLRLDGIELMLNTAYEEDARPPAPDPARLTVHEDTCLYFGCPDVDAAYAYLRARGVPAKEPKVAHYGMKQLYVSDPDGYNLCFQWPAK